MLKVRVRYVKDQSQMACSLNRNGTNHKRTDPVDSVLWMREFGEHKLLFQGDELPLIAC